MSWVAVAVGVGSAVVGAYGANQQSKAAKQAGQMGADAAARASEIDLQMYSQARQDAEPWRHAGLAGLSEYMSLLGLPAAGAGAGYGSGGGDVVQEGADGLPVPNAQLYATNPEYRAAWDATAAQHRGQWGGKGYHAGSDNDWIRAGINQRFQMPATGLDRAAPATPQQTPQQAQQAAFDRFRNQPGYQFGLQEGQRALDASASSQGGLFSGAAGLEMQRYGQNYADQQGFTPYMNRLASLSGIGQTQTQNNAQYGQQVAQNAGNNLLTGANARASGLMGSANAWSNWGQQAMYAGGQIAGAYANRGG